MALFQPVKLGPFQLQHRIVISPALRYVLDSAEHYFEELAPEGGLVLVPSLDDLGIQAHQGIVNAVHGSRGVAFSRVRDTTQLSTAVAAGYDGVEIDAGTAARGQSVAHTSALLNVLCATTEILPADRIGIRFAPFAIVDGDCLPKPLSVYITLLEEIKHCFPALGFVHFVAETTFDDLEHANKQSLDCFRATVTFPSDMNEENKPGPLFVSSNAYTPDQAQAVAARTTDLICVGLAADSCPDVVSLTREKAAYRQPTAISSRLAEIDWAFRQGKEYNFEWDGGREARATKAMSDLECYISRLDSCTETTRTRVKDTWFACHGIGQPLLQTENELSKFKANLAGGLRGLQALRDKHTRATIDSLKRILDSALLTASKAAGIRNETTQRCTIHYQIISPQKTLHADSHLLTAIIATGPGMRVYDVDGAIRQPETNSTVVMGGTTLYRWSNGKHLPTFHEMRIPEHSGMSIAAFFDFPDMAAVPRVGCDTVFFNDIGQIQKDDQSRTGELVPLWDIIAERHRLGFPLAGTGNGGVA
ncbi:hypothetical protein PHISP_00111 [Aspergillus sp. HF37]|nr:hypothetical protein PHISP_00111 [Aspergillus sp. HF37]